MTHEQLCRQCGHSGIGAYCGNCGAQYSFKRISMKSLFHDVFHFFTHLEKGFLFTLKQLTISPGAMQRRFIDGDRSRFHKPFSLFFICASLNGLLRYWLYSFLGESVEASYFHLYLVTTLIVLMPFFTLISWLLFYRSRYNYAENGVLHLYAFSFVLLASGLLSYLKLVWHHLDTALIEYPLLVLYTIASFIHFFRQEHTWIVAVKALIWVSLCFLLVQWVEDTVIEWIKHT